MRGSCRPNYSIWELKVGLLINIPWLVKKSQPFASNVESVFQGRRHEMNKATATECADRAYRKVRTADVGHVDSRFQTN